jgi:putative protease
VKTDNITVKPVELLSPAKDLTCGLEAIRHGADAVYIGAPKFSARAAAGNSVDDIKELCEYAHLYNAKIYVALNTILDETELMETEKLIHRLYNAGIDALIIQDMGIIDVHEALFKIQFWMVSGSSKKQITLQ